MPLTRRHLLRASALAGGGALLPWGLPLRAAEGPASGRRFVFVVVFGGWDVTRVFAPAFDNPVVSMEVGAYPASLGGLDYVYHSERPSVQSFLQAHHERTLFLNGLVVPSLSHTICLKLALTGGSASSGADWPAMIASGRADDFSLPMVVVRGPQFPGPFGGLVTRIGTSGAVEALLDGSILGWDDGGGRARGDDARGLMDSYVQQVAERRLAASEHDLQRALAESYAGSLERGAILEGLVGDISWGADASLTTQAELAVDLLRLGVSRCVTLTSDEIDWDSHQFNDARQSALFEQLFAGLNHLMDRLAEEGLAEDTVVVVLSEMGRTPQLNDGLGKDHWSHTSAMLVGPGITGGRVVGGYDEVFASQPVDLATGELHGKGTQLNTALLGATLLKLAGMDPAELLPTDPPIDGILTDT